MAKQAALALDLDGACRERASGRVVGRAARALDRDGACRERASGRVAEQAACALDVVGARRESASSIVAGQAARRERASSRMAEQAALALDLDGACLERASGRVAARAARAVVAQVVPAAGVVVVDVVLVGVGAAVCPRVNDAGRAAVEVPAYDDAAAEVTLEVGAGSSLLESLLCSSSPAASTPRRLGESSSSAPP